MGKLIFEGKKSARIADLYESRLLDDDGMDHGGDLLRNLARECGKLTSAAMNVLDKREGAEDELISEIAEIQNLLDQVRAVGVLTRPEKAIKPGDPLRTQKKKMEDAIAELKAAMNLMMKLADAGEKAQKAIDETKKRGDHSDGG